MEPLVHQSAPGGFVVAVLRDELGLWIGSRREAAERYGATLIEDRRAVTTSGPGWTAVGGPLPGRAGRAVVRGPAGPVDAALGGGAFVAVLPANEAGPAVRFEDADGLLVRDPPRGDAIRDATDRCAACTALDWELTRGDCVRCRACGHTFRMPLLYGAVPYAEDSPTGLASAGGTAQATSGQRAGEPRSAGTLEGTGTPKGLASVGVASREAGIPGGRRVGCWQRVRPDGLRPSGTEADRAADALRVAPGPVYAVPGGAPEIRGFGGADDAISHITLATGEIEVDTRFGTHEAPEDAARAAVAHLTTDVAWPARSRPAIAIWLDARRREREEASANARPSVVEISVDGHPRSFTLIRVGRGWAAAWDGIVVSGRGDVPSALHAYNANAS